MSGIISPKNDSQKMDSKAEIGCISITKPGENSLRINGNVLRKLLLRPEIADNPIAIISITGRMRAGKSFLLNFFIRYFRNRGWKNRDWIGTVDDYVDKTDINWTGGAERCTKGLMLFRQVFEVPVEEDRKIVVLLMDTQGLFDMYTPEIDNKSLLTLSTMASSVQIFNTMQQINMQDLSYLKTCMDFAIATAEAEQTGGYLKLQRLMFLVRDFPEDGEPESCYTMVNGEKYLSKILNSKEGGDQNIAIRKRIRESFENVRCFLLSHPGIPATRQNFSGRNGDLDPDFLKLVKTFVEEIASPQKLEAKAAKGKNMTGRELLNMIMACDEIFAAKLFEAGNVMEANERAHYSAAYEEAIHHYNYLMMSHIETETNMSEERLKTIHGECRHMTFRRYDSALLTGSGKYQKQYRDHLDKECKARFELIRDKYSVQMRSRLLKGTENALKGLMEYEKEMEAHLPCGAEEFEKLHLKHFKGICKKYNKGADMAELEKKLKAAYEQFRRENWKRHEEHVKAVQEKKRSDLEDLVFKTLSKSCNEGFRTELQQYQDGEMLEKISEEIRDELNEAYWQKALTDVELKYKKAMDIGIDETGDKVIRAVKRSMGPRGPNAARRPWKIKEQRKTPLDEMIYQEKVEEEVNGFAENLREELERIDLTEDIEDTRHRVARLHRRNFFNFCSEDLLYYRDLLRTDVMYTAKEKAVTRNNENWNLFQEGIRNKVKESVLGQEDDLGKMMADQHLHKDRLETYYKNAEDDMKKEPPKKYAKVISSSRRAKEYFERMVNEMMSASKLKMMTRNEENKKKRMVDGIVDIPKKKSLFKKAWAIIKPTK